MASLIERTVQSMLDTIPLRRPRQGTVPTPRMVIPSSEISPTTAHTFVVPMSRPTTISPCVAALLMHPRIRMQDANGPNYSWPSWAPVQVARAHALPSSRSSPHPHDHPLGAGFVVEHDGVGLGAATLELRQNTRSLLDFS